MQMEGKICYALRTKDDATKCVSCNLETQHLRRKLIE
jgi:hypothetical protein